MLQLTRRQRGFSLPELMVVLAIIMLLVTLAVPRYGRSREFAEEAGAAATMRSIHTSQEAHRITHGSYAASFGELTEVAGAPGLTGQSDEDGDVVVYRGYIYRLNRPVPTEYTVTAEPVTHRDERPHFEMDERGYLVVTLGEYEVDGGATTPGGGGGP